MSAEGASSANAAAANVAAALSRAISSSDRRFLFGPRADVLTFGGAVVLSGLLIAIGALLGWLDAPVSPAAWLVLVLGIDVAHVWTTIFRVYLDPSEVRARLPLYLGVPLAAYAIGAVLYGFSSGLFWRAVAYLAVWHFMRQQIGWMRLYHRRDPAIGRLERALDEAVLWLVMLHPVVYWHAHLPRRFAWMVPSDFLEGMPIAAENALFYGTALVAFSWIFFHVHAWHRGRNAPWGRWLLVGATAAAWYVGIVVFNSDFAFTATNIPLHGIPYAALTFRYGRARAADARSTPLATILKGGFPAFLACVWALAFAEEAGWDRWVWHDHENLFGRSRELQDATVAFVAPLLAVPQLTHYVLDGFIWRRGPMQGHGLRAKAAIKSA